jgi:tetratricopeptide (TPR) repeat protein
MGREIARALSASELAADFGDWNLSRLGGAEEYLERLGTSDLDVAAGLILTDLHKMADWPFDQCYENQKARAFIQERINVLESRLDPVQREVFLTIAPDTTGRLYDYGIRHHLLADRYRANRMGEESLRELMLARRYWWPMAFLETDLALLLAATRRPGEAEEALQRARSLDPEYPAIHYTAGTLYHIRGRLPEAAQEFQAYLQAEPYGRFSSSARKALDLVNRQMRQSPR